MPVAGSNFGIGWPVFGSNRAPIVCAAGATDITGTAAISTSLGAVGRAGAEGNIAAEERDAVVDEDDVAAAAIVVAAFVAEALPFDVSK